MNTPMNYEGIDFQSSVTQTVRLEQFSLQFMSNTVSKPGKEDLKIGQHDQEASNSFMTQS